MDNVIQFPKKNMNDKFKPQNIEEIDERMQLMKMQHVGETLANVSPMLFSYLDAAGFNFSGEQIGEDDNGEPVYDETEFLKDGAFLVESIRSMLCRYHNIEHPFQKIAEAAFKDNIEEDGTLTLADNINVKLVPEKGDS